MSPWEENDAENGVPCEMKMKGKARNQWMAEEMEEVRKEGMEEVRYN